MHRKKHPEFKEMDAAAQQKTPEQPLALQIPCMADLRMSLLELRWLPMLALTRPSGDRVNPPGALLVFTPAGASVSWSHLRNG